MSNSLQDQLLGAGLIDKKKAKTAAKENRKKKNVERRIKNNEPTMTEAQKKALEKKEKDREINRQRQEAANEKAIKAQIIQLIEHYQIGNIKGEIEYHFKDNNTVKRLSVNQTVWDDISSGRLCIAKLKGGYRVIPKPIAEKISERDSAAIIVANTPDANKSDSQQQADDDYYAQFEIPDDLMW